MPKITIYVPDDLKAQMDAFEKQEPNWSAVAQEAFQLETQRLANRKRSKGKMDAVIERLRESKQKRANKSLVLGHTAGRNWAMDEAEADVLERVAKWQPPPSPSPEAPLWRSFSSALAGNDDWDDGNAYDFFEEWANAGRPSDEFVIGFAQGAREIWNHVADKL